MEHMILSDLEDFIKETKILCPRAIFIPTPWASGVPFSATSISASRAVSLIFSPISNFCFTDQMLVSREGRCTEISVTATSAAEFHYFLKFYGLALDQEKYFPLDEEGKMRLRANLAESLKAEVEKYFNDYQPGCLGGHTKTRLGITVVNGWDRFHTVFDISEEVERLYNAVIALSRDTDADIRTGSVKFEL